MQLPHQRLEKRAERRSVEAPRLAPPPLRASKMPPSAAHPPPQQHRFQQPQEDARDSNEECAKIAKNSSGDVPATPPLEALLGNLPGLSSGALKDLAATLAQHPSGPRVKEELQNLVNSYAAVAAALNSASSFVRRGKDEESLLAGEGAAVAVSATNSHHHHPQTSLLWQTQQLQKQREALTQLKHRLLQLQTASAAGGGLCSSPETDALLGSLAGMGVAGLTPLLAGEG